MSMYSTDMHYVCVLEAQEKWPPSTELYCSIISVEVKLVHSSNNFYYYF
jgi:hypothetical protein